jgi:hypothetical protein
MATSQQTHDESTETESDAVTGNSYRENIERVAPLTVDMGKRELKAAVSTLYYAKDVVDNMHPDTRKVHEFDQSEIREIERNVRSKVSDAKKRAEAGDDRWAEITLTADEIVAIESGLTTAHTEDNRNKTEGMHRLDNLLTSETAPRT